MNHDTVIIGGGQAGLAIGRLLADRGHDFTILDAADTPAAAWQQRWDSLRLFTPARYDSLPGTPFPAASGHYPSRDEVVAYLTDYARKLPVQLRSRVQRLHRTGDGYTLELAHGVYTANQVVVATGAFQTPRTPAIAERLDPAVVQLHSSRYRNPGQIPAGTVLVVGGGNTGYQIAEELSATHPVHLSISSRQTPLPQRVAGRDLFQILEALGAMRTSSDSRIGQRLKDRDTLIGSSPRAARRRGIQLHGRTISASESSVAFADGNCLDVRTVIWATGFGIDHSWIEAPIFDNDDRLIHTRGITPSPGLYFIGLPWQHTRGSALLGWVKHDAAHIAQAVEAGESTVAGGAASSVKGPAGTRSAASLPARRSWRRRRVSRRRVCGRCCAGASRPSSD
jgi:putative flavoprotein involved in K+ transport